MTSAHAADGTYEDRWVSCTPSRLVIRWYYFPFGSKRIPYEKVRGISEVRLGLLTGKWRGWGSTDLRHWYHLDTQRWRKEVALVLDVGHRVRPVITPDQPRVVRAIIERHLVSRAG